ncbi:ABC transporter substrate-binding protein [Bradyrhizobium sp. 83012]|uniref:ABC transporter substrate-binding protein n=1 Tax=Bradyrhizobium aeschynomenes TaxID=2734909 RepID=A0ABX2C9X1_9BRAD|nr:ABC transporter substrate-binding protein [Bradyrhizobium aeschynomenes]NPU13887.1 ABC transporter substrate-binding protein [Bradyrhizobium aeschynomenes]NPU65059.1 ABC transporter substrate-binding protein [Bradyrhizobium aeschynomenes]NPV24198.1 ABC transporter substrate-binding protein [Bradyrhizobium aeschynomenes]
MRMRRPVTLLALALLAAVTAPACLSQKASAEETKRAVAVMFALDRPIDGSMAPIVLAAGRGLFGTEGVTVTTTIAKGSPDAIARVASGEADMALADINELIRYRDTQGSQPVKAVFVLFNKAPYAIIARKSRGINGLADLEGKTLGVAEGDLSIRLWPAVVKHNHLKSETIKLSRVGAAVREPILSAGQVDAVSGFSYLSALNLRDRGVPAADLAVLRFADYGCEAYGHAVIVSPGFAAKQPAAVKGVLRALTSSLQLAIKDPAGAIADVVARMDDGSRELELERLQTVLADNVLTSDVRRDGIGGIDPARFERALDQLALDGKFRHKRPLPADIFDDGFLPPADSRLVN